jgi:hypothetical protein
VNVIETTDGAQMDTYATLPRRAAQDVSATASQGASTSVATQSIPQGGARRIGDREDYFGAERSASVLAGALGADAYHRPFARRDSLGHALFTGTRHGAVNQVGQAPTVLAI